MKKGLICAFLITACCLPAAGCGDSSEDAAETTAVDTAVVENAVPTPPPNPLDGLEPDAVVATVNGTQYTRAQVDKKIAEISQQYQGQIPPGMESKLAQQALSTLVDQQLLLEAAAAEGVTAPDEEVQQTYDQFAGRAPSPQEFQVALTSMGFTEETFRAEIAKNLAIEKLLDQELANAKAVTPEDVEAYYRDNLVQFQIPEQVQASHILLSTTPKKLLTLATITEEPCNPRRKYLLLRKKRKQNGSNWWN